MAYTKDEWWLTKPDGKRIGWMQPTAFVKQVQLLTRDVRGVTSPMLRTAKWLGVGKSTVYRWADGTDPIPKWVALLLETAMRLQGDGPDFPVEIEAPWLPLSESANGVNPTKPSPPDGGTDQQQPGHAHAIVTSPTHNVRWPKGVTP